MVGWSEVWHVGRFAVAFAFKQLTYLMFAIRIPKTRFSRKLEIE
jgi:hypothetical protein